MVVSSGLTVFDVSRQKLYFSYGSPISILFLCVGFDSQVYLDLNDFYLMVMMVVIFERFHFDSVGS